MKSIWDEIEQTLVGLYSLPHNRINLKPGQTPQTEAKAKVAQVRSGLTSVTREDFSGPMLFLRVVGPSPSRPYSGEWWFDATLLDTLETAYSRIYFTAQDRKRVLRDMLRELLAIASEWNKISEIWALELPAGQVIRGYSGTRKSATALREPPLERQGQSNVGGEGSPSVFSREESSLDKALSKPCSLNLAARRHLEFRQQASSPSRYLLLCLAVHVASCFLFQAVQSQPG